MEAKNRSREFWAALHLAEASLRYTNTLPEPDNHLLTEKHSETLTSHVASVNAEICQKVAHFVAFCVIRRQALSGRQKKEKAPRFNCRGSESYLYTN